MSFPKIRKKQKESQNYEKLIPNQDFDHKRDQDQHQDRAKTFLLIVFIRLRILRGNFQKECHKLVFYSSTKIQRRPRIDQDDDQDFAHDRDRDRHETFFLIVFMIVFFDNGHWFPN